MTLANHPLLGLILILLPLSLCLGLAVLAWRHHARLADHPLYWGAAFTLASILLDGGLLAALPALSLSHGTVPAPWAMVTILRIGLLLGLWLLQLLPWRRPGRATSLYLLLGAQVVGTVLEVQALYVEPQFIEYSEVQVGHPALTGHLRIAHITDLHLERLTPREQRILARLEEEQPDLIVLTGDYVAYGRDDDALTLQQTRDWLSALHAPLGVYAVSGNVDEPAVMSALFDGLPIRVLHDEVLPISTPAGPLTLVGIHDDWDLPRQQRALTRLAPSLPPDEPSILLFHKPDLMPEAKAAGITLALAGHTHGGQVRVPGYGALLTMSAYGKRWEGGVYREEGTTLVVSRGLGLEGFDITPRMRLFCRPEVVLVDLGPI